MDWDVSSVLQSGGIRCFGSHSIHQGPGYPAGVDLALIYVPAATHMSVVFIHRHLMTFSVAPLVDLMAIFLALQ